MQISHCAPFSAMMNAIPKHLVGCTVSNVVISAPWSIVHHALDVPQALEALQQLGAQTDEPLLCPTHRPGSPTTELRTRLGREGLQSRPLT